MPQQHSSFRGAIKTPLPEAPRGTPGQPVSQSVAEMLRVHRDPGLSAGSSNNGFQSDQSWALWQRKKVVVPIAVGIGSNVRRSARRPNNTDIRAFS
jgi:hypothetical protein